MDFQDYLRSSYEYNENEEVSKVNDFQRSYSVYYETYNEYESETKYMYRCDGVMNDYVQTTLLNPEPSIEGEQYRVLTEYYEQPACAEIDPQDRILTIFPNPSSTYLTVLCHEPLGQANLRILDNMGRLVYENKNDFPNYFSIDLAAFNEGAHILQIDNGSYKSSQKFVVIK